jgi:hypothetical protein
MKCGLRKDRKDERSSGVSDERMARQSTRLLGRYFCGFDKRFWYDFLSNP